MKQGSKVLNGVDEPCAHFVLFQLHLDPDEFHERGSFGVLASGLEDLGHATDVDDLTVTNAVHNHMTVPLEQ